MQKYIVFKTFIYSNLPEFIQSFIKDYMQDKFRACSFITQQIGESFENYIELYGEKLTEENSNMYVIQQWFINQDCKNEEILILVAH